MLKGYLPLLFLFPFLFSFLSTSQIKKYYAEQGTSKVLTPDEVAHGFIEVAKGTYIFFNFFL